MGTSYLLGKLFLLAKLCFFCGLVVCEIQNRSPRLWACLLGVYWVTFVTYYMLWKACIDVMELRATAIASPGVRPEEFTVLVRDIPPALADQTMKEHVDSYFSALHGNKQVNKIWKVIEEYRKKLARAEGVLAESARRHTCRTGFLGVVGEKVDTIDPCNKKIKELLPKFEAEQQITLREKQEAAALVFFNSRAAAVSASQTIRAQKTGTWTVTEAAEPRQLLWANLPQNCSQRRTRSSVIHGIVFLTVCFFTIPVAIVGLLANYNYPAAVWAGLGAFLPQVLLVAFFALLSRFLMFLSKKEGLPFESQAVRAAIKRHFCFVVFDVFLGFTVWGTFLDALQGFIDQPSDQFMPLLGLSVPRNSNFFITFIALKFFICNGLEISRLFPLIIFHFKKKFIRKTEAEVPPGDLGYASRLPSDMLVITLVLCYSVAAPMIIPFGAVYFGLGWLITKNQVLRVYIPKYESKGSLWPDMYAWVVATVIIYQACMIGYVVAWKKFYFAFLLTPLILISLSYAYLFEKRLELKEARGGQRV
ncbi:hypothetical protein MUK42_20710 [Musa troglodytarum]|uniref:CSC1-like protein ERD4 n=1 Tax=Musa troglodytarum TaxID=320322 RepID=A0A9E7F7V4_9LILI|nr:hypothetical protein MUK42_20710 [Musa troglodytarum]URD88924.1 hypothetical protein MUK42_20710 [Musa troglodytarum]